MWPKTKRHYKAGESAPVSGIYRVSHVAHRAPHEVIAIVGEELPRSRTCKNEAFFEVVRPFTYVTHDWDLAGPAGLTKRAA